MTPITRAQAVAQGIKFFYTGRACHQGHDSRRYTSTGQCVACMGSRGRSQTQAVHQGRAARLQGHFSYPVHPDDHAAALAFCQALDLQRGRVPFSPAGPAAVAPTRTLEQIEQDRRERFASLAVQTPAPDPLAHGWK